jgi:hypothetical protein
VYRIARDHRDPPREECQVDYGAGLASLAKLELVRTAAFLVWAVASQGCDLSGILAVSRAILLAICADTGAGFVGALPGLASHS